MAMDCTYEITNTLGTLSTSKKGWTKEVNLIKWNGKDAKIDIRDWAPEREKMGRGVTLTDDEAKSLVAILLSKGVVEFDDDVEDDDAPIPADTDDEFDPEDEA